MTSVLSRIDSVLAMPDLHSTLIQDSFRSGFLLNESGVEWASLGSLMFAQIRTISTSFYHLWAGFENAAFLGYYQQDTLFPNRYSIAWQTDWNHSCAYNYTNADWEVKLDVPNSGKAAVTNPFDDSNDSGNRLVPNHCREIYTANPVTGTRAKSFEGDPYDCRYRSWYFDTKRSTKNKDSKRWTSMYIDRSTNNPAFAKCAPLTNLTSKANRFFDGLKADKNGLVGVTCTGLYIVAISKQLLDLNSDISTKGSFIVERSSGLLVAASSSEISDYYSAPNVARVAASKSNNDYIRFASSSLAALSWPDGYTAVFWVTTSDAVNFPSLVEGDAYYVSVSALEAPGLTWDVVVIQKVLCKEGEYVDTVDFMCGRCATPAFSTGGAPAFCNNCVETNGGEKGYFFKSSSRTCEQCPAGATCKGLTWLPFPGHGKWVRAESEQHLSKEHMTCNEPKNCPGTISSEGGDAALACFKFNQTFVSCNASANERVCRKGSRGRMCGLCTTGFYLSAGEGCLSCSDPTAGSLIFYYAMIFMIFVLLYLAFQHYEWLRKQIFWKALTGKGRLKIILATAQIVGSIQWSTQVFWGEPFLSFANMLSLFQLDFVNVLPFTCAVAYPLTHQILMSTLLPLLVLIVMRVPCFRVYGHIFSRGECINLILTGAFVVLPSTSLTLFKFYDCTLFPDGKWFLTADLSMECYTRKYRLYLSFTSFMLFVYPLGIPLAFLALLYPRREAIASRDPNAPVGGRLHKFRFLVEDYKPSHWHGEVLRSWMRVILAGFIIVFSSSRNIRAAYGCLCSFFFVVTLREYKPYADSFNNSLALGAQHQIFFTYVMSFLLVTEPIPLSKFLVGVFLLLANVFWVCVYGYSFWEQLNYSKERARLKALGDEVAAFSSRILNTVAVRKSLGHKDLTRFVYGDWATLTPKQRRKAARVKHLDIQGIQNEDELTRFLEVTVAALESGLKAQWFWKEDADRMSAHDENSTFGTCWVAYADSVAAQLEYFHNKNDSGTTVVDVDVSGRVTSATSGNRGKAFRGDTGSVYSVDLEKMLQINSSSKFERKVMRKMVPVHKKNKEGSGISAAASASVVALDIEQVGTPPSFTNEGKASFLFKFNKQAEEQEPHPFPADLADSGEPILLMQPGMLLQVQRYREGWAYGVVVYDPVVSATMKRAQEQRRADEASRVDTDGINIQTARKRMSRHLSKFQVSRNMPLDRAPEEFKENPQEDADDDDDDDKDEEGEEEKVTEGSASNGWFPLEFTGEPTVEEMHAFQDFLGGQGPAEGIIKPPLTWSTNPNPLEALCVNVEKGSEEWGYVERSFMASLGNANISSSSKEMLVKELCTVRRVENVSLWQSYAAKKKSLSLRAEMEGRSCANYEMKEDRLMFHGSTADAIPKICQQGFNRSCCTETTVQHGKGVYFARHSGYAVRTLAHTSDPNETTRRMFLCRVLVGEFCQGKKGKVLPARRNSKIDVLFDSTTDSMVEGQRNVFVTYQDAQVYPEYLIEYKAPSSSSDDGSRIVGVGKLPLNQETTTLEPQKFPPLHDASAVKDKQSSSNRGSSQNSSRSSSRLRATSLDRNPLNLKTTTPEHHNLPPLHDASARSSREAVPPKHSKLHNTSAAAEKQSSNNGSSSDAKYPPSRKATPSKQRKPTQLHDISAATEKQSSRSRSNSDDKLPPSRKATPPKQRKPPPLHDTSTAAKKQSRNSGSSIDDKLPTSGEATQAKHSKPPLLHDVLGAAEE